jgi:hypothetical protein
VKPRQLADRAVDEIGFVDSIARIQVRLDRHQQGVWRFGKLTEHRLTADHDEVALIGNRGRRPQQVFKRGAGHDVREWRGARRA